MPEANDNMNPRVSIIILNWNGWEDTLECLESVYQIDYPSYNVVVVDNNSEDESLEMIKKYSRGELPVKSEYFNYETKNKPLNLTTYTKSESETLRNTDDNYELVLIENDENNGFADGTNVGIRYALKSYDPDYVLLLNNDTVVDKNFLDEMVKIGESHEKIGFIGPKTFFYDVKDVLQKAGGGRVDMKHAKVSEIGYGEKDDGRYNNYYEPDYVGGECLLVKKEVIERIGLLDTNFFMYWEDVDWCFSGHENGYPSGYAYKARIWHKYGSSSDSHFKIYYLNRNRLYFTRKHANRSEYIQFLAYFIAYILFECVYQLIRRRDVEMYRSYSHGLVDGFKIHPQPKNQKK